MSIWSNATISRFAQEAENYIARECNCILDRVALSTSVSISTYVLPEYVLGIDRVTWKGKKLDPIPQYELPYHGISNLSAVVPRAFQSNAFQNNAFQVGGASTETPQSEPYEYFYNGFGQNTIRFFPNPNEAVAAVAGSTLWGSAIKDRVIVQFWRLPDFTSTDILRIPGWYRRSFIKSYVLWKCFSQEGKGQDLQAAKYYENKFKIDFNKFKLMINQMYIGRDNSPDFGKGRVQPVPASPVLPLSFGTVLE